MPLDRVRVTQSELNDIAERRGSVRAGSTSNIHSRAGQYERDGYGGVMFYAPTQNQMRAEDKLLEKNLRHNEHTRSNAPEKPGYCYVIKGRKYNN